MLINHDGALLGSASVDQEGEEEPINHQQQQSTNDSQPEKRGDSLETQVCRYVSM